jgi:hypothetical protein
MVQEAQKQGSPHSGAIRRDSSPPKPECLAEPAQGIPKRLLVDILGLNKLPLSDSEDGHQARRNLMHLVSAYKAWQFDSQHRMHQAGMESALFNFIYTRSIGISQGEFESRIATLRGFVEQGSEELREAYDTAIRLLEDGKPSHEVYHALVGAYVEILANNERVTYTCEILDKCILPNLGSEGFVDGMDFTKFLELAPKDERDRADHFFLEKLKRQGISKGEIDAYHEDGLRKDKARTDFHKEIERYGATLGMGEIDVMADIVVRFHHKAHAEFDRREKRISACAGALLIYSFHIYEGTLKIPAQKPDESPWEKRERLGIEQNRKNAEEVLRRFLEGHGRAEYKSDLSYKARTLEEDRTLLEQVKAENPDLPITVAVEPSHNAHGATVYSLGITIELGQMFGEHPDPPVRLEKLMRYLEEKLPKRHL